MATIDINEKILDIDLIKKKILEKNDCFFLPTGKSYSACTPDFTTTIEQILLYDANYNSMDYFEVKNDNTLFFNNKQLYLYVSLNDDTKILLLPIITDPGILSYLGNNYVTLDKFFLTSNGIIYIAKDKDTIYKIQQLIPIFVYPDPPCNIKVSKNLEYESISKFLISTIKIPAAMKIRNTLKSKLQSIWNYDFLRYGQVEELIKNNTDNIRYGWWNNLGEFTRYDGKFMTCDGDNDYSTSTSHTGGPEQTEYLGAGYGDANKRCHFGENKTAFGSTNCPDCQRQDKIWPCCAGGNSWVCSFDCYNNANMNACAEGVGNNNALPNDGNNIITNDRLSFRCKQHYTYVTYGNRVVEQPNTFTWSPWAKATADSQIYFDFCSEHDTISDRPMYEVNSNCQLWIQEKPERLLSVKNMYCTKYPESNKSDCGKFCADDDTRTCKQTLLNFCKGSNLEYKNCKDFAQELNINLDQEIKNYCQSMTISQAFENELCGCFMSQDFYNNYFGDLKAAAQAGQSKNSFRDKFGNEINIVQQLDAVPDYPICYYANCATSGFIPYTEKSTTTKKDCPNVTQCIQVQNITNTGNINADSVTYGSQTCILTKLPGTEDVNCKVSNWSPCVEGKRTRTILTYPENNGQKCPELTGECNTNSPLVFILIFSIVIFMILLGIYIRKKRG